MVLRECVHLLFSSVYVFCIYYDLYQLKVPDVMRIIHEGNVGRLKYLTVWNLHVIAMFFILSLINDLFGTRADNPSKRGKLQTSLDVLFTVIAIPTGLFVFTSFWSIYLYNRELIFPLIFDTFFPSWLNHLMHTVIVPAILGEMILVRHFYPQRRYGVAGLVAFFATYLAWIHVIAFVWQFWTYPILEALNWWQRIVFYAICILLAALFYFTGEFLCRIVWGKKPQGKREKKKSRSKKKTT